MDLAQLTHDLDTLAAETSAAIEAAPDLAALGRYLGSRLPPAPRLR